MPILYEFNIIYKHSDNTLSIIQSDQNSQKYLIISQKVVTQTCVTIKLKFTVSQTLTSSSNQL